MKLESTLGELLYIGFVAEKGKGRNYLEFDVNSSLLEWIENPRYHTRELTVKGNVKIKNGKFFKRN